MKGNEYIVKTIVTSELAGEIARKNGVEYYDVYTGFKYIAEVIRENEGIKTYIGGGEESFGFLPADFVRDKDAVSSCALMAEIAAWAKDNGRSLFEMLQEIYITYGTKVSVRPSGTEPKIKFYIEVKDKLASSDQYDETDNKTNQKVDRVMVDLGL